MSNIGAEGDPERPRMEIPPAAYTQINVLFPQSSVELPSAEKFKAFPPEAQQTILATFRIEQQHRHQWMTNQQANNHALNMLRQKHAFLFRALGLIAGVVLVLSAFACGLWLVQLGQAILGVACFIVSVATLIGTAIYGHRARSMPSQEPQEDTQATKAPQIAQK